MFPLKTDNSELKTFVTRNSSNTKVIDKHFRFNPTVTQPRYIPATFRQAGGRLDQENCFGMFHLSSCAQLQGKCDAVECSGASVLQQRHPADTGAKLFALSRTVDAEFQARLEHSRRRTAGWNALAGRCSRTG